MALVALYSCYYIYDIAYPREAKNTLLVFEKMFFGIHGEKLASPIFSSSSKLHRKAVTVTIAT